MNTKDDHLSRRNFLKHSTLGAVGLGLGFKGFESLQWAIGADEQPSIIEKSRVIAVKN
ncbi:MAG: twin-arginine translocation signal domain-containing protein, partial [Planctomycetes bacterium]|nr:twin-arginine translocation signal domain-containing protein [Planctomycetota bacterium]